MWTAWESTQVREADVTSTRVDRVPCRAQVGDEGPATGNIKRCKLGRHRDQERTITSESSFQATPKFTSVSAVQMAKQV